MNCCGFKQACPDITRKSFSATRTEFTVTTAIPKNRPIFAVGIAAPRQGLPTERLQFRFNASEGADAYGVPSSAGVTALSGKAELHRMLGSYSLLEELSTGNFEGYHFLGVWRDFPEHATHDLKMTNVGINFS